MAALVGGAAWTTAPATAEPFQTGPVAGHHLRGGLWDQLLVWLAPGPAASAAIGRIVARVNALRLAAGVPPLIYSPKLPLIFSVYEEYDSRGPDGQPLADAAPNQELFIGTMVRIDDGDAVVLFLTDQVRSSVALTEKGVPGVFGRFSRNSTRTSSAAGGTTTRLEVACTTAQGDDYSISTGYADSAAKFRFGQPDATAYLEGNIEAGNRLVYATRPTQTFLLHDRSHSTMFDLPHAGVELTLKARHHDPEIDGILNDAANVSKRLMVVKRLVRIERAESKQEKP